MIKYVVQLSRIIESGVENWTESFDTLPEAEARILEANTEGSGISADPIIIEDREGPTG